MLHTDRSAEPPHDHAHDKHTHTHTKLEKSGRDSPRWLLAHSASQRRRRGVRLREKRGTPTCLSSASSQVPTTLHSLRLPPSLPPSSSSRLSSPPPLPPVPPSPGNVLTVSSCSVVFPVFWRYCPTAQQRSAVKPQLQYVCFLPPLNVRAKGGFRPSTEQEEKNGKGR